MPICLSAMRLTLFSKTSCRIWSIHSSRCQRLVKDTKVRRYEHNGEYIEITPSVLGLATIYDKDILLYCISQLMHRLRNNLPIGPRLRVPAYDLLVYTNRGTAGKDYDAFCVALKRLAGTRISTNIRTGNEQDLRGFGMIDTFHVHRKGGSIRAGY